MAASDISMNDAVTMKSDGAGSPAGNGGADRSMGDGPTMRSKEGRGGRGAFAPGDIIAGRYVVEQMLGEGGMGIVYQCLDRVGGVKVAVKCLPPEVSRNADEMEDIRANYRLVSDLHHPNIAGARTLELDESTGDYYLVMDLAPGMSLKRWMKRNPQASMEVKLAILRQVAAALDYAHAKKIIHRDVKPENVMVDDEGGVKVLDFGLAAQIRSSQSRTSAAVASKGGTPGYKSPEQWLGRPQRAAADVYAFGVMAYWMFAGMLPFDGDDPSVLGHAVLTAPVVPVAGLPAYMNAALAKALAKTPEERFLSCGAFMDALEGKSSRGGAEARSEMVGRVVPDAPQPPQSGGPRSFTAVKGVFIAAIIAALVGGGMWLYRQHQEQRLIQMQIAAEKAEAERKSDVVKDEQEKRERKEAEARAEDERELTLFKNGHKGIQLWEGGPYWATTNIGAEKPEDYGYYFWWGDTVGYKRENGAWVASNGSKSNFSFNEGNTPTYRKSDDVLKNEEWITTKGVLAPEHDAAHVKWGGRWRMPTKQELDDLKSKCDWEWTTLNGVRGYKIRGKGVYASVSIFLPCAGYGYGPSLNLSGSSGYYWSSVPYSVSSYYAGYLFFYSGCHYTNYNYRGNGFAVRPVQGFAK